jgi:hypothetical protein
MPLIDNLLDIVFPRGRYGKPGVTRDGVPVRSGAEQRIAAYFDSIGLRYEYEKELEARFWIFKTKVSTPDFYLPDHDVYVEYWGMLDVADDEDRKKYTRSMTYKMIRYQELGIKCVSLYPHNLITLDQDFQRKFKRVTGTDLPYKSARKPAFTGPVSIKTPPAPPAPRPGP